MFRHQISILTLFRRTSSARATKRSLKTLTSQRITELLAENQVEIPNNFLPSFVKSLECNQLASNSPIEDRLRVSSIHLPGSLEPTMILGVFDGHGGGTTADIISRRLFNYIALSLHPEPQNLKISDGDLVDLLVDLHNSPLPEEDPRLLNNEIHSLSSYKKDLGSNQSIASRLKSSFTRCDNDLSEEIQKNLTNSSSLTTSDRHHYLSAAVSGCCAIVMVIHRGFGYLASTGDCRAVLGSHDRKDPNSSRDEATQVSRPDLLNYNYSAIDLNDEHNCDNINEIKRLANSHPHSEQNTMIRHNRLLGHLMPFRAFGDFNYKWTPEVIKSCGIIRAFGHGVIPSHYNTPPYLTAEPDVNEIDLLTTKVEGLEEKNDRQRCLIMASDGLWELFESSRDVIEAVADHSINQEVYRDDYDANSATHILRAALRSSSQQDYGMSMEDLKREYHVRLESILTLPQEVVRNFRDDISLVVVNLN